MVEKKKILDLNYLIYQKVHQRIEFFFFFAFLINELVITKLMTQLLIVSCLCYSYRWLAVDLPADFYLFLNIFARWLLLLREYFSYFVAFYVKIPAKHIYIVAGVRNWPIWIKRIIAGQRRVSMNLTCKDIYNHLRIAKDRYLAIIQFIAYECGKAF